MNTLKDISCHEYWLKKLLRNQEEDLKKKKALLQSLQLYKSNRDGFIKDYPEKFVIISEEGIEILDHRPERGYMCPSQSALSGESWIIGREETSMRLGAFKSEEDDLLGLPYIEYQISTTQKEIEDLPRMIGAYKEYITRRSDYIDNHAGERLIISIDGLFLQKDEPDLSRTRVYPNSVTIGKESQWDSFIITTTSPDIPE